MITNSYNVGNQFLAKQIINIQNSYIAELQYFRADLCLSAILFVILLQIAYLLERDMRIFRIIFSKNKKQ